jgi:DNA-binding Lrp family transcriptional regulator
LKTKLPLPWTELEKTLIGELTGDLEIGPQPFLPVAERLGLTHRRLLHMTRRLVRDGVIRRFGATLRHRNSGFEANAMAVWRVPADRIENIGRTMAAFREVTHCYHRKPHADWPYNLYTMIHAATEDRCREVAQTLSRSVGLDDYQLLFSHRELKKTTMRYFHHE